MTGSTPGRFRGWWAVVRDDARDWCTGRSWPPRALLLVYVAYAGLRSLGDPDYGSWFSGITLAFHEMGHVLFAPFGEFLQFAGGSITQVAIPLLAAFLLFRQGDYFGVTVAGGWMTTSLCELARYIGDARAEALPLVGLGDDPEHDWHFLLETMGLLRWDTTFARLTRCSAFVVLAASVLLGVWLLRAMAARRT